MHAFPFATGRPAPALQPHVDALGLALPCICFNGAAILHMAPRAPPKALHLQPLAPAAVAAVLAFADAEDLCCSYSLFDRAVARSKEWSKRLSVYGESRLTTRCVAAHQPAAPWPKSSVCTCNHHPHH